MGYPPLEDLLPKAGMSIYKLVRMAAIRATQLAEGAPKLIETTPDEKTATIALEEIKAGKVVIKEMADDFAPTETEKIGKEEEVSA